MRLSFILLKPDLWIYCYAEALASAFSVAATAGRVRDQRSHLQTKKISLPRQQEAGDEVEGLLRGYLFGLNTQLLAAS